MNTQLYKTANNDIVDAQGNGVVNAQGEVYLYKDANGNTVDYYGNGIVDPAGNPYAYNDAQGRQITYFGEPLANNALQKIANDAAIEEEQHRSFLAEHWPKIVAGIAAAGALGYGGYAYNKHRNLVHNDPDHSFLDTLMGRSPYKIDLTRPENYGTTKRPLPIPPISIQAVVDESSAPVAQVLRQSLDNAVAGVKNIGNRKNTNSPVIPATSTSTTALVPYNRSTIV